jgi:hypothetical protein
MQIFSTDPAAVYLALAITGDAVADLLAKRFFWGATAR